ncbi:unnamed protein product [Acanthosepion pharaonis]|uniref:Uncharacterized protein n=1 Tax=Acanthosepion pharaonis TaxID=158019 RepID=A0A812DYY6_ACAPH|nr:unnamed protein product [Sepia pharaonis]
MYLTAIADKLKQSPKSAFLFLFFTSNIFLLISWPLFLSFNVHSLFSSSYSCFFLSIHSLSFSLHSSYFGLSLIFTLSLSLLSFFCIYSQPPFRFFLSFANIPSFSVSFFIHALIFTTSLPLPMFSTFFLSLISTVSPPVPTFTDCLFFSQTFTASVTLLLIFSLSLSPSSCPSFPLSNIQSLPSLLHPFSLIFTDSRLPFLSSYLSFFLSFSRSLSLIFTDSLPLTTFPTLYYSHLSLSSYLSFFLSFSRSLSLIFTDSLPLTTFPTPYYSQPLSRPFSLFLHFILSFSLIFTASLHLSIIASLPCSNIQSLSFALFSFSLIFAISQPLFTFPSLYESKPSVCFFFSPSLYSQPLFRLPFLLSNIHSFSLSSYFSFFFPALSKIHNLSSSTCLPFFLIFKAFLSLFLSFLLSFSLIFTASQHLSFLFPLSLIPKASLLLSTFPSL